MRVDEEEFGGEESMDDQKIADALWERWQQQEAEAKREWGHSSQLEPCPKCGSQAVVDIVYGFPTDEMKEAVRRGAITLGGCMLGDARFFCKRCDHCWPEDDRNLQP